VQEFEEKAFSELPSVEKKVTELVKEGKSEEAKQYVTSYTNSFAGASMARWEELKIKLWGMFGRGF
jgi:dipeptidase